MSGAPSPTVENLLSPRSSAASTLYCNDYNTPIRTHRSTDSLETPENGPNSPHSDESVKGLSDVKPLGTTEAAVSSPQFDEPSSTRSPSHNNSSPAGPESMVDVLIESEISEGVTLVNSDDKGAREHEKSGHADAVANGDQVVTVRNAQNVYRPEACVFVANLPKHKADVEIERILRHRFGGFGEVYIKVRRDGTKLPIAFCQYTNVDDAERALSEGSEVKVFGRGCRVEKARCQRALFVTKTDGSFDAARDIARVRALLDARDCPLENIWAASPADLSVLGLPPGLWVQFQLYGDCQDAYKDLRNCSDYRFEFVPERSRRPRHYHDTPVDRYGIYQDDMQPGPSNGSAILVKNLPPMFDIPQICQMFTSFGLVIGTQIVSSTKEYQNNLRTAVVQFFGPLDAGNAVSFANQFGIAAQDALSGLWCSLEVVLMWPPAPRGMFQKPILHGPKLPGFAGVGGPPLPLHLMPPTSMPLLSPATCNSHEQFGALQPVPDFNTAEYTCQPYMADSAWVNGPQPLFMR